MNQKTLTLLIPADGNATDVSFGGVNYPVADGKVTVPVEAAEHLYQFGFTNAPPEAAQPPATQKTGKQGGKKQGNKPDEQPTDDQQNGNGQDGNGQDGNGQDGEQGGKPVDDNNGQNDGSGESA